MPSTFVILLALHFVIAIVVSFFITVDIRNHPENAPGGGRVAVVLIALVWELVIAIAILGLVGMLIDSIPWRRR